jgi:hypothetical protein
VNKAQFEGALTFIAICCVTSGVYLKWGLALGLIILGVLFLVRVVLEAFLSRGKDDG